MKISSIAALLLIGTTIMMAETALESEEMFNELELPMHHEEALPHETNGVVADGMEGTSNTYYGLEAGNAGGGDFNSFFGRSAGKLNTGDSNTFSGYRSGLNNTTGTHNAFSGSGSGYRNTTGDKNTFSGSGSGSNNTTGTENTFIGYLSGFNNTTGIENTFSGNESGYSNTTGNLNTFIGYTSGYSHTTGINNTFIGYGSGYFNQTGSHNVFLGGSAGFSESGSYKLYIDISTSSSPLIYGEFDNDLVRVNGTFETVWSGENNEGDGLSKLVSLSANNTASGVSSDVGFSLHNAQSDFIWNFRTSEGGEGFMATKEGTGGAELLINNSSSSHKNVSLVLGNGATCTSTGQWVNASSKAYKENIKTLDTQSAMEAFKQLNPVTFNFKRDEGKELMTGFIAEEVPQLVATKDRKGINALEIVALLTKVVKEQEKINKVQEKELKATRTELQAKDERMVAMEARQKAQDEKIANLESILTNLALDTSNTKKEKVSVNLK
ncbi:tail fiber domain-containing protein [Sulfurovum sp. CS9]|uniref:tail fiber domain-containing protein n=1 Tax=Sulfurovum sp. CS9 TaxID=3391146 RepID=UPI0039E8F2EA